MRKKQALGALLLLGFVACKDDGEPPKVIPPDVAPVGPCNPLTQTGCEAGEKCTWINDQDNPPIGHVGCAPDPGTAGVAIGQACTDPPAGPQGYDNCVKGAVCLSGECKQICDHQGGAPTCDANHSCANYADFFETGGSTVAGVCDPGCDPLTQDLKIGANVAACGSPMANAPNKGCYGYDAYSCAPTGMTGWALTDRMTPQTSPSGNPYLNGCAPGFIPLFFEMTGSTVTKCTGMCAALEVDNTTIGGLSPAQRDDGDAAALGKLPTTPKVAGDATCGTTKKGSEASSTCRFMWPYLVDDATGELPMAFEQSIYRDTLGVCMAIAHFRYDSDGDMTPDTDYPSCTTLPRRSAATTGDEDDAADWGCQKLENSMPNFTAAGGKATQVNPALRNVRLPKQTEMVLSRHRFH